MWESRGSGVTGKRGDIPDELRVRWTFSGLRNWAEFAEFDSAYGTAVHGVPPTLSSRLTVTSGSSPTAGSVSVWSPQATMPDAISRIDAFEGARGAEAPLAQPSAPPSTENDPARAASVSVSKSTPSSGPIPGRVAGSASGSAARRLALVVLAGVRLGVGLRCCRRTGCWSRRGAVRRWNRSAARGTDRPWSTDRAVARMRVRCARARGRGADARDRRRGPGWCAAAARARARATHSAHRPGSTRAGTSSPSPRSRRWRRTRATRLDAPPVGRAG